jgi:hypothetical protein
VGGLDREDSIRKSHEIEITRLPRANETGECHCRVDTVGGAAIKQRSARFSVFNEKNDGELERRRGVLAANVGANKRRVVHTDDIAHSDECVGCKRAARYKDRIHRPSHGELSTHAIPSRSNLRGGRDDGASFRSRTSDDSSLPTFSAEFSPIPPFPKGAKRERTKDKGQRQRPNAIRA